MPFDANGNFSLVPGTIVADGMNVLPSQHNPPFQDVANGLSQAVVRDGRAPMTGVLNMNGNKITGVASGDQPSDVVTNADIADLGVAIGDGKWSLRDLSPNWLRRDGSLYLRSEYPELADLMPPLPDGVQWVNVNAGPTTYKRITASPDLWVMATHPSLDPDSYIYTSVDGESYSQVATLEDFALNTPVTYGNGIYAVGGAAGKVSASNDGVNWSSPVVAFSGGELLYGMAVGAGVIVAVGAGGKIATSPDGATWTDRTSGVSSLLSNVRFVNSVFVAVGSGGVILTSPDGVTWTPRTSGVSTALRDVTYGNSLWVVIGESGLILTSSNLSTWTSRASGTTQRLNSAAYSSAGFIVVGDGGIARISDAASGTSWAASATGITGSILDVIVNPVAENQYFAAVNSSASLLKGTRTLATQFQVPNDGPNEWVRAL